MLSDEQLRDAFYAPTAGGQLGSSVELRGLRAVAQLAATHERERLAGLAGVDVDEIAAMARDSHGPGVVKRLATAIREALAASEARHGKDTERLDWINSLDGEVSLIRWTGRRGGEIRGLGWVLLRSGPGTVSNDVHPTARAAIDAARSRKGESRG